MTRRGLGQLILALFWLAFVTTNRCQAAAPFENFDEYVESVMQDWRIPGLSLAVVADGKVTYVKGYGKRSVDSQEVVDTHTVFAIGSLTKAFTSAAAAQLVSEKKIKWDDRACRWLTNFQLTDPWASNELNLTDMLGHRTGIADPGFMWWGGGFNSADVLKRMRYVRPTGPFRARYAYNNVMYLAAGQCLEASSGKSWHALMHDRLFVPLSMTESTTSTNDLKGCKNLASPHKMIANKMTPIPFHNLDNIAPAGAINSSADDMSRWLAMQVNDGKVGDTTLVAEKELEETRTPQIPLGSTLPLPEYLKKNFSLTSYCLGWVSNTYRGKRLVWHTGAIDGMHSILGFVPESKSGIVVLTNLDQRDQTATQVLLFRTLDALLKLEPIDWRTIIKTEVEAKWAKGRTKSEKETAELPKDTHPTLPLAEYAGKFESSIYGPLTIKASGDELSASFGNLSGNLKHRCYNTFRFMDKDNIGDPIEMNFLLGEDGKVEAVRATELGWFDRKD